MAEGTSLGDLGVAKVLIRVDWGEFDKDLESGKIKIGSAFEKSGKLMRNVGAALTAGLTVPLAGMITTSTLAASRVNELELVNTQLGKSAGYTESYIRDQENSVQDMGIEAAASREIIADYIKAELDLADASKIARVAQDASVISGENSTDTTKTLTQAIITGRTELFKSAGMIVDLNTAYKNYAELTGDVNRELTEQEKIQARVNMTLEYGERITGAYLTAMEDPGKVLRSYPRYLNDVAVAFGQNFIPAFSEAIFAGKDFLEWLKEAVSEGGTLAPVIEKWGDRLAKAGEFIGNMTDKLDDMDPAMIQSIADFIALGAAMGPVLLVGGQLLIWIPKAVDGFTKLNVATGGLAGPVGILATALVALGFNADLMKNKFDNQTEAVKKASLTYEEYVKGTTQAATDMGFIIDEQGNYWSAYTTELIKGQRLMGETEWAVYRLSEALGTDVVNLATDDLSRYYDEHGNVIQIITREKDAIKKAVEAQKAFNDELAKVTGLDANFSGIIGMAKKYDQIMGDINSKQIELDTYMQIIEEGGGYLDGAYVSTNEAREEVIRLNGDIVDLGEAMTEMANQVVLDMFMATISIGGITEAEAAAYFKMAEDMDIISEGAANYAMQVYGDAVDYINSLELDDKSVTYTVAYQITGDNYNWEDWHKATGGPVSAGNPYLVGEKGPELFVPSAHGSILSNSDSVAQINQLLGMKEGNSENVPSQTQNVNVYASVDNEIDLHKLARRIADEIRRGA